jgi:hypothetical protein
MELIIVAVSLAAIVKGSGSTSSFVKRHLVSFSSWWAKLVKMLEREARSPAC